MIYDSSGLFPRFLSKVYMKPSDIVTILWLDRGFVLIIRFIENLHLVTTATCNDDTNSRPLHLTTGRAMSSTTSLAVA